MSDKTTEEAAEEKELLLEIDKIVDNLEFSYDPNHSYNMSGVVIENQHLVVNQLHNLFNTTIAQLREENERLKEVEICNKISILNLQEERTDFKFAFDNCYNDFLLLKVSLIEISNKSERWGADVCIQKIKEIATEALTPKPPKTNG